MKIVILGLIEVFLIPIAIGNIASFGMEKRQKEGSKEQFFSQLEKVKMSSLIEQFK